MRKRKLTIAVCAIALVISYFNLLDIEAHALSDSVEAKVVEVASKDTATGVEKTLMITSGSNPGGNYSSAAPSAVAYVNVSVSGAVSAVNGNVTCIGTANNTSLTIRLQSLATGGVWTTQRSSSGVSFRTDKSISVCKNTTQTRYWRINLSGIYVGNTINYSTNGVLFNAKAVRYPLVLEVYSGKKLLSPPTNYIVKQTPRDSYYRSKYISNFEGTYPKANVTWSNYQIHHIRPLKYGGTNSLFNGIAITNAQHSLLTKWWINY